MRSLARLFQRMEKWLNRREAAVPEIQPGSRTFDDDQATNPYHLSHAVETALSHSLDHLHALRTSIEDANTIHMVAPFTLMRAALENAALASWLLLPENREDRIRRRMQLAIEDAADGYQVRLLTEDAIVGETFEQRRERLVGIGVAQGLSRDSLLGGKPKWKSIVREAGAACQFGADDAEVVWRLCSGFTHGRMWSMLAALTRTEVSEVDDVFEIRMNAPASAVLYVAKGAADMFASASTLHDRHRLRFTEHKGLTGQGSSRK